jgi:hypothetical protein
MSNWGSSFATDGLDLILPAGCLLVPLLERHASRVPAELRGCDCHHSRAPLLEKPVANSGIPVLTPLYL